jgi:hypothetical protein
MNQEVRIMNYSERGSGTLEILIAFAVLILSITAMVLVSFGNQATSIDAQTAGEALYKTKGLLEDARAQSHESFNSVVSATATDDIYLKTLSVSDLTPCRKQLTGRLTWSVSALRQQYVELTTQVGDMIGAQALGGDCATEPPAGGWSHPGTLMSRELNYKAAYNDNPLIDSSAGNQGTGIDVLRKMIYMTGGVSTPASKDDFFVLDASDVLSGTIPPIVGSLNTGAGLNAVDAAYDSTSGNTYAYVAHNDNQYQLQIIDVSSSTSPAVVASTTLPNITFTCSPASDPCLAGTSVFYYDQKVYVGTAYIANLALPATDNNEFHVYCVAPDIAFPACNTSSPSNPIWLGSFNVNHNVNAIVVQGDYAYLATSDDDAELTVLDVGDPTAITLAGYFDATRTGSDDEDGLSLFLAGNTLYLGREEVSNANERDFYILNVSNPAAPAELGSKNLALNAGSGVSDITVGWPYAFLAITDPNQGFEVLGISDPSNIVLIGNYNYSESATGIDFEDDFIYSSNAKNDALRIIRPAQCSDKIDDDGDGKIDSADPDCHIDGDATNSASYDTEDDDES